MTKYQLEIAYCVEIRKLEQPRLTACPKWEIVAPEGYRFSQGSHTLICWDLKETQERLQENQIVKCLDECETCNG
jgi:hypothetical protein